MKSKVGADVADRRWWKPLSARRLIGTALLLSLAHLAEAQIPPSPNPPNPVPNDAEWNRQGNSASPGNNNTIGTFFSSPMYFYTGSLLRMRINGNMPSVVNGLFPPQPRNGYVGIGENVGLLWSNVTPGPFSLLHLNGPGSFVQQFGFRQWMQTGITFTSNNDLAYIGHKRNGSLDITDLVFAWGDNGNPGPVGPDILKFVFTTGTGSTANDLTGDHPDGREILRMTGWGNVGIGPRFNNTPAGQPQSQLHINSEYNAPANLQITVENLGQTATDGVRIGLEGNTGNARLDEQENANLLFSTNTANALNGGERMRLSSVSTPPTPNLAGLPLDRSRVSISHRPSQPVDRPLSLLHLGYNTGGNQDGWRRWMDVGTFTSQSTDHLYAGLKQEPPNFPLWPDRYDAVIGWGDNPGNNPLSGPDNLRFIFTSATTNSSNWPAQTPAGREVMRITPEGRVGIGDYYTVNPFGSPSYIDATLDIDGDLRIRTLNQDNNLTNVLVADPGDKNKVHWRDAATLGLGQFFQCGTAPVQLPSDSWWQLDNHNFIFDGQGGPNNAVGIGTNCAPTAKLHVSRQLFPPAVSNPTALRVEHSDVSLPGPLLGIATGLSATITGQNRLNTAGNFVASGAPSNTAVQGNATGVQNIGTNIGGRFSANGPSGSTNFGIWASVSGTNPNFAGYFNGDVHITGVLSGGNSDRRLKRDIQPIANSLEILSRLRPKTFYFDTAKHPEIVLPRDRQYGLVAQEVEAVLPEVVREVTIPAEDDSTAAVTYKTVNYNAFIGLLIDGVQKQQAAIDELRAEVAALSAQVKELTRERSSPRPD